MQELSIQNLAYLLITISCEDFLIKKRKEEKKIGGGGKEQRKESTEPMFIMVTVLCFLSNIMVVRFPCE